MNYFPIIQLFILFSIQPLSIKAQSSFLDPDFGANGRFTHDYSAQHYPTRFTSSEVLSDGKIIAGGYTFIHPDYHVYVVKCLPDGGLDSTFATNGEWILDNQGIFWLTHMLLQPDGKILLGTSSSNTCKLIRLQPNGDMDNTFGVAGISSYNDGLGGGQKNVFDMQMLPNGSILLATGVNLSDTIFHVARLKNDGSLDATFGNFGKIVINANQFGLSSLPFRKILPLSDNSLLVFISGDAPGSNISHILKYSATGNVDPSFDSQNIGSTLGFYINYTNAFELPDHKILALGNAYYNNASVSVLIRLHPDGQLDTTFADNGKGVFYCTNPGHESARAVNASLQVDGKVLFCGDSDGIGFLGRFTANGEPDFAFGNNGMIYPETDFEIYYDAFEVANGKIVTNTRYRDAQNHATGSILRYLASNNTGLIDAPSALSNALIYPNPVGNDKLHLEYSLPAAAPVRVDLLDMNGGLLYMLQEGTGFAGENQLDISVPSALPNGLYYLNIQSGKGNAVLKITLTRT